MASVGAAFGAVERLDVPANLLEPIVALSGGHLYLIQLVGYPHLPGPRQGELPLHRQLPDPHVRGRRAVRRRQREDEVPHPHAKY